MLGMVRAGCEWWELLSIPVSLRDKSPRELCRVAVALAKDKKSFEGKGGFCLSCARMLDRISQLSKFQTKITQGDVDALTMALKYFYQSLHQYECLELFMQLSK